MVNRHPHMGIQTHPQTQIIHGPRKSLLKISLRSKGPGIEYIKVKEMVGEGSLDSQGIPQMTINGPCKEAINPLQGRIRPLTE